MKKIAAVIITGILCVNLWGCGNSTDTDKKAEHVQKDHISAGTQEQKTSCEDPDEDESLMNIETKYGTLYYPAKFKDNVITDETEENGIFSVNFSTEIDGKQYVLFKVMICDEEGDTVGTVCDKKGNIHNIFIDINDVGDISDLDEESQNQIFAMQEGVNVLEDNLTNE